MSLPDFFNTGLSAAVDAANGNDAVNFIISPRVVDSASNKPLEGATIQITDKFGKARLVNGNVIGRKSMANGSFTMPIALPFSYIKVTYVGYAPSIQPANKYKAGGTIFLDSNTGNLKEVTIKGTRPKINTTGKKKTNWTPWIIGAAIIVISGIIYLIKKR